MSQASIMVVEDEYIVANDLKNQLEELGYRVTSLRGSGEEALQAAEGERPDLVLMDIMLDGAMDGVQAAQLLRQRSGVPVIFLTAYADGEVVERAKRTEPYGYLLKPFDTRELGASIEMALYRATMEERLKESEERYRSVVENAGEAIVVFQKDRCAFFNPRLCEITGYQAEELEDMPFMDLVHPQDRQRVGDCYRVWLGRGAAANPTAFRFVTKFGEERWVETNTVRIPWAGEPAVLTFAEDITERRRLETRLLRGQKLESLGLVAAGLSHDYNNILMGVMSTCELAREQVENDSQLAQDLDRIYSLSQRAVELTRRMLEFTGKGWLEPVSVDLSQLVSDSASLIRGTLPAGAELLLHGGQGLPLVLGDASQLQRGLMALAANAGEALGDQGGMVRVATALVTLDAARLEASYLYENQPPGEYVMLEVCDNGCGVSPEQRELLFDPFYSTKFLGRGLGLPAVLGIVRSMQGALEVESSPGQGACFRIFLPKAQEVH